MAERARIAILGASGYTGAETIRLAAQHPNLEIRALTADRHAGKPVAEVFPHLGPLNLPQLVKIDDLDLAAIDAIVCCLPHGTTQEVITALPRDMKIVDLSADFRLRDPETYAAWYGRSHTALELQNEAVYGLTEANTQAIANARLVANPGCYPTACLLPLLPLLKAGAIDASGIVVDAKTGVTGAGRALKENLLFAEVHDGINAYGIGTHRHLPEMEQELSLASGSPVELRFTPHLLPINRGILATAYVRLKGGFAAADLERILSEAYGDAPFTHVVKGGRPPSTREVRGTNLCLISVHPDRVANHAILVSVIDNLTKGSSGQALHNLNLMLGLDETTGLNLPPVFP